MNALLSLWLPILLSAVVVFVVSSLIHMVFKWHAPDYRGFANEDAVREAVRAGNPTPGRYVLPYCADMKEMNSEAMLRKYREGPVAHVLIGPSGVPNMGKHLGLWFLWSLAIAVLAGYLAWRVCGLDPTQAARAAQWAAAITFIAHGCGTVTESIWGLRAWSSSVKHLLDAVLYGIGSGLVFWWLWP